MQQVTSQSIPTVKRRPISWSKVATIVGFLAPALILYCGLVIFPVIQSIYFSLFRWNGLGPLTNFTGLANYQRILGDRVFTTALSHNIQIVIWSLLIQLPIALGLALLVRQKMKGRAAFRLIFFLPFVLSEVVSGVIWNFVFKPDGGLVTAIQQFFVPGSTPLAPLANPNTVLYAVFIVIVWKYFGYHMTLYLAGLQNIPPELEEAAQIDGCNGLQTLRYITIPLLGPTIRLTIYLSVLGSLQLFDLIWAMTGGGPVGASDTMATYMFKHGFQRFQLGYGSAIATILFTICFGFSVLYQFFVMRKDIE
jgi:raffinose/stachyose/melibiose transport system permease protein